MAGRLVPTGMSAHMTKQQLDVSQTWVLPAAKGRALGKRKRATNGASQKALFFSFFLHLQYFIYSPFTGASRIVQKGSAVNPKDVESFFLLVSVLPSHSNFN